MDLRHVIVSGQAFANLLWHPGAVNGSLYHSCLFIQRKIRIDQKVVAGDQKDKFLDDVTVKQLEKALGVRVRILPQNGGELLKALLK